MISFNKYLKEIKQYDPKINKIKANSEKIHKRNVQLFNINKNDLNINSKNELKNHYLKLINLHFNKFKDEIDLKLSN